MKYLDGTILWRLYIEFKIQFITITNTQPQCEETKNRGVSQFSKSVFYLSVGEYHTLFFSLILEGTLLFPTQVSDFSGADHPVKSYGIIYNSSIDKI